MEVIILTADRNQDRYNPQTFIDRTNRRLDRLAHFGQVIDNEIFGGQDKILAERARQTEPILNNVQYRRLANNKGTVRYLKQQVEKEVDPAWNNYDTDASFYGIDYVNAQLRRNEGK